MVFETIWTGRPIMFILRKDSKDFIEERVSSVDFVMICKQPFDESMSIQF